MSERPLLFVAFGITGDLMKLKVLPALFYLYSKKTLPPQLQIIGISRKDWDDAKLREYIQSVIGSGEHTSFLEHFIFLQGDIEQQDSYSRLHTKIQELAESFDAPVRTLFHLAIAPDKYEAVFKDLAAADILSKTSDAWPRFIIEKPFGASLPSAQKLMSLILSLVSPKQVYLVDHYLHKEVVEHILDFRFTHKTVESIWSGEHIKDIRISLLEKLGVETRGSFYDQVGALRDMGQSHLLSLLSLLTTEQTADIREGRKAALEELSSPSSPEKLKRAQYQGYRDITGVRPDSQTETYFHIETSLDTARWKGMPIFLESGKRLGQASKGIVVAFKEPQEALQGNDTIIFRMEPKEEIIYTLSGKPDHEQQVWAPKHTSDAYTQVIARALAGEQAWFISPHEMEAAWKFIDPIEALWKNNTPPLTYYVPDQYPPKEEASI